MNGKVDLSQQEIVQAANAGVQLLQTPGAVNVPSPMAITGVMRSLHNLLNAIAAQEVIVINAPPKLEDAPPPPEGEEDAKPDLKPVGGKQNGGKQKAKGGKRK